MSRSRVGNWKDLPLPKSGLGPAVVRWFRESGRTFPWRETKCPFRVLCTEILLQRTRARQVAKIFDEHVSCWQGPEDVLQLGEEGVRLLFERLGLVWRAKYFWQLQLELQEAWNGTVPQDTDDLQSLPGVGSYASSATRIYAFGEAETAVDANVLRIFGRVYGIEFPDHARRSPRVLRWASAHCPGAGDTARAFNWGLVDLGSIVCSAADPRHSNCPVADRCWLAGQELDD